MGVFEVLDDDLQEHALLGRIAVDLTPFLDGAYTLRRALSHPDFGNCGEIEFSLLFEPEVLPRVVINSKCPALCLRLPSETREKCRRSSGGAFAKPLGVKEVEDRSWKYLEHRHPEL